MRKLWIPDAGFENDPIPPVDEFVFKLIIWQRSDCPVPQVCLLVLEELNKWNVVWPCESSAKLARSTNCRVDARRWSLLKQGWTDLCKFCSRLEGPWLLKFFLALFALMKNSCAKSGCSFIVSIANAEVGFCVVQFQVVNFEVPLQSHILLCWSNCVFEHLHDKPCTLRL